MMVLIPLKGAWRYFKNLPAVIFRKQVVAKLPIPAIKRIKKRPPGLKVGIKTLVKISNKAMNVNLIKKNILNHPRFLT
jgi:hypothetical protein